MAGWRKRLGHWLAVIFLFAAPSLASSQVVVGGSGSTCFEDPGCFNRLHPDVPMAARAKPGDTILFHARDIFDVGVENAASATVDSLFGAFGKVHALTGPVFIEGAQPGDTLAVTLTGITPGPVGWTIAAESGFGGDMVPGSKLVIWQLDGEHAVSDDLPGVRIPNASFPGVMTTLPGDGELQVMLEREAALLEAGGIVFPPDGDLADPPELCGIEGVSRDECLRTIPPREHGGNMDIRYLGVGVTVYLPCYIEGCGLAIGDLHFAQGDGEVSGTAIEMAADVELTVRVMTDGPDLSRGPHYEGPARLLSIPSTRFYAVTGFPIKEKGEVPREIAYLASAKVADLANLSNDINLAARNALAAMIDHIVATYGYDRLDAYVIASIAVDLRIGQLVDTPNVGVTAILPLDIFENP